jgi:Domain of unknown function DUF11/Putative Ig domain
VLLLPNDRGTISLPADVTPAVATFTYTETDVPTASLGTLVFAGLDFALAAVDAASGAVISSLVDAPRATIVLRDDQMRSARITDLSRLGLFWWSGSAWVNQLPCAGCAVDPDAHTLTVSLSQFGEYALAAAPPPPPVLTITPAAINPTAGIAFAGSIATFPPADPLDQVNQFAAIVSWGDGQTSPVEITAVAGVFVVSGSHTWSASGSYPVGILVFDNGTAQHAQGTAVVAPVQVAPQFTTASPPLTATQGVQYSYAFGATGVPAPTFALAAGAPSWLSVGAASGVVSGTPPSGTTSFTYTVVASNGVMPNATAGPFVVVVSTQPKQSADVSIAISGPATAAKGSTVTYTLVVTNNGPSTAVDGSALLLVEPDASLVGATPPPFIGANGLWIWRFATLDPGRSATFTIKLKLTRAATVTALGTVASETRDPNLVNNVTLLQTKVSVEKGAVPLFVRSAERLRGAARGEIQRAIADRPRHSVRPAQLQKVGGHAG